MKLSSILIIKSFAVNHECFKIKNSKSKAEKIVI
jgi:hypothetical protein